MTEAVLPADFSDLEPFAATWCLATEAERYARRMASTMAELEAFYQAGFPRIGEALGYCDKFPLDGLPDDAHHLLQLVHSLIMVAMCVEIWHQPNVIDGADAVLDRVAEPLP
ncbi:hypothetical protein I6A84_38840 [Frankia sp. CNm7]|uniref:Xaa-Pro dipeptidase n=1 Tax=Frankia nepalensis TaxID=1836974 RepID=A0A937RUW3_9ACTN|nr:hypothetical protein [Frankia nepalensis]MBL7501496.1 hypothetical protein [Frankia nepalensis]MBL7513624.1 hypothetical protein [Frankia nepalensis]MBL7523845.1 hypothetical protein [Frankia nepalensis]MBL7633759.1 hypothetical protein [Frankia nepalensis]